MVPHRLRAAALAPAAAGLLALAAPAPAAPPGSGPPPAAAPGPDAPLDPDSAMAPLPDLGLPWPDPAPGAAPPAPPAPAAARGGDGRYRVALEGLDDVDPAVRARFNQLSGLVAGEGKPANAAQIDRRARDDEGLLRDALRAAGHYDAEVTARVRGRAGEGAGATTVVLTAAPGARYRFADVALPGLPAGPVGEGLRRDFGVAAGDPVSADRVQAGIAALKAGLGRQGYPFAEVAEPAIELDAAATTATLVLTVRPGRPARFGRVLVEGARPVFTAAHVATIARFRAGDPYDAALLEDLRRALINTSLVSVATVATRPGAAPGTVDVVVHIERAPPRTIAGALGYGTGEGVRAEASWQHRNLLPPEGAVTFRGILGTREQSLSASLRRANLRARDHILNAQVSADHSNFQAYDARTLSLSLGIERQTNIIWQKRWSWSLGTEFLASDERDTILATGAPRRRTYLVAALPAVLGYDRSDDLLNPSRGFRLSARVSPEASLLRGAGGYVKAQLDASAYRPVGARLVIAGRVRVATIAGATRDEVAPSRRLYAGGGGSVRGYGYQRIGPVDANGDPAGGRGLAEAAIEARVRFGNIGIVPFLDAGTLTSASTPSLKGTRYGTGIGARYYTSFGPIRVDLGTPIRRRAGESKVAIYVSLGQAF